MKLLIEKISDFDLEEHKIEFFKKALKSFIEENNDRLRNQITQKDLFDLLEDFINTLPENTYNYLTSGDFKHWAAKIIMKSLPDKIVIGEILTNDYIKCNYSPNFIIPEGVKLIDEDCFRNTDIKSVTIPSTVINIGKNAFCGCHELTDVIFSKSSKLEDIGPGAFASCIRLNNINIPNSVNSIGDLAFGGCDSFTNISIPDNVKIIEANAFTSCENLKQIKLSNNLTTIEKETFFRCVNLIHIEIPSNVKTIKNDAFCRCSSLTSVIIPDSVTEIEYGAFGKCPSLTSITIPNSVINIEDYAFENCVNLTTIYYDGTKAQWEKISHGASFPRWCQIIYKGD